MHHYARMPYFNLDMDGVSADFDTHYLEEFGHSHKSVPDDVMWNNIDSRPDFFATIPLLTDAYILLDRVAPYDHGWLTACPKHDFLRVSQLKREWNHVHNLMKPNTGFIPSPGGRNKPAFLQHFGAVLIDDFDRNVKAWREAGGIGILHRNIEETMEQLDRIIHQAITEGY